MSIGLFLVLLGVGSAAIASWTDARFPTLGPRFAVVVRVRMHDVARVVRHGQRDAVASTE